MLVLLLLAFDVCIHLVVRLVGQKVIMTLISHGLMRSVRSHVMNHVLLVVVDLPGRSVLVSKK